jgi:outer membrane protein
MNSCPWILLATTLALLPVSSVSAETLHDAIDQAYATNPRLAAARERQDALAETPEQARAAGRPTITATAEAGYDNARAGWTAVPSLDASLPIWTGGRVSAATRAASGDVAAGAQGLRDTEAAVLESVVVAYSDLLYNQQAVRIAQVGIKRLEAQVAEARLRFRLGQSTLTDVAQLEAQRASVAANRADAEGSMAIAAATYLAIVGRVAGPLSADVPLPRALPLTQSAARDAAEARNPILLQQRRVADAAAARIDQQQAEGAPSIALTGSYGYGGQIIDTRIRGYEAAATAGIALRIPLLTGGLTPSRVRQAKATYRAESYQTDAALREAIRASDSAWATLIAARSRLAANIDGLAAAEAALKGVRAEYGFGLRNTLDILVADQSLRAAQLAVARGSSDVLVAQAALLRATGAMNRDAF